MLTVLPNMHFVVVVAIKIREKKNCWLDHEYI